MKSRSREPVLSLRALLLALLTVMVPAQSKPKTETDAKLNELLASWAHLFSAQNLWSVQPSVQHRFPGLDGKILMLIVKRYYTKASCETLKLYAAMGPEAEKDEFRLLRRPPAASAL